MFADLPQHATYTHSGGRAGHEAVCFRARDANFPRPDGFLLEGGTAAIEDGRPWTVQYRVAVDATWRTTRVEASGISESGHHVVTAEVRDGRWWIDDTERPDLDECVDIDFESSLVTNTLAVHRIDVTSPQPVEVPAAYVRANDLRVERIEQSYLCRQRTEDRVVFDYTSTTFDFACRLVFDSSGLVVDYPGIGRRHT